VNVPRIISLLQEAISNARRDLLAQQFRVAPEDIVACSEVDPTNGKYTAWIAKMAFKTKSIILPEDAEKVHSTLTLFAKLSQTAAWTGEKDLNKYATYGAVAQAVRGAGPGKKQAVRTAVETGKTLINRSGDQTFWLVTTPEAAATNFRDTEWCVKDPKFFKQYGPPFFYLEDTQDREQSCLLHFRLAGPKWDIMCMDFNDDPVSLEYFDRMDWDHPVFRSSPKMAVYTAKAVAKGVRWPEMESTILQDETGVCGMEYFREHMEERWSELETLLLDRFDQGKDAAFQYLHFVRDKADPDFVWPELEAVVKAQLAGTGDPGLFADYAYAASSSSKREPFQWAEGESLFLKRLHTAQTQPGWEPTEDETEYVQSANLYCMEVRKGRWPEYEAWLVERGLLDAAARYGMAMVDPGTWPEFEALAAGLVIQPTKYGRDRRKLVVTMGSYFCSRTGRSQVWEDALTTTEPVSGPHTVDLAREGMKYWEMKIPGRWPALGRFLAAHTDEPYVAEVYRRWKQEDDRIAALRTQYGRDPEDETPVGPNDKVPGADRLYWGARPNLGHSV